MNTGSLFWIITFALSAATFFIVAVVVAIRGFGDLMDLLRVSEPEEDTSEQ